MNIWQTEQYEVIPIAKCASFISNVPEKSDFDLNSKLDLSHFLL